MTWRMEDQTENEQLRRRLKASAVARSLTILRNRYPEECAAYRSEELAADPTAQRTTIDRRAERRVRDAHRMEYEIVVMVLQDQLQKEVGYVSQARQGRRNLIPGGPRARKVDADAAVDAS